MAAPHITPRELQVLARVLRGESNKAIANALGVSEQAIKEHVSRLMHKLNVPNRAALAEAGSRIELTGGTGLPREWVVESRVIDLVIQPLHDEAGAVNGIVSFAVDVTELVAERRRMQMPSEIGPVLELIPNAVVIVDPQGQIVRMNDAARRMKIRVERWDLPIARALRGETVAPEPYSCIVGDPPAMKLLKVSARPMRDAKDEIVG